MSQEHTTPSLNPEQAAWLADTFARNHARFAGWSMEADPAADPAAGDPDPDGGEDPTPDPANEDPADQGEDGDKRARQQAARYRTERNALQKQLADAQQAQQDLLANIAQALGVAPKDAPEDPAAQVTELTGQVQSLGAELAQARAELAQVRAELLVHELAGEHQANAVALLDSRAFTTSLHGLDPSAEDYRTKVAEAIKDAVSKNATLRAKGQVPARGGAAGSGQGPAEPDGAVTKEQFDAMSYRDKSELFRTNPDLYRRLAGN
ncbi:hypothetical protein ACJ5H2_13545 [Nocardioides sp. R1-1]|uniref:hypothetical protein n=1 Tax=Nocardioides sp. R1-1 TaxID=3383502 RepID=UPI0038D02664